ncbi:flagellar basal body rod protein FlgC [Serpentinicella alkaliphila]|uniref:Flagellar basal-body rod protein FlgC n=1 Tax=Serpentinicella alkaliphila TaxID=1734049 RepID=A0A4R2TSS5_9FIRM|nr:flagellar basal body rod protein FlgC [Serpentinicella alkaliphila]QUH26273.1 flagellar basal body rod protein FlgC [Serpentinicella alkaliphila]TCQ05852.1 flagellar basal-body rod protein FlgC [Serpentinicella alkaliphila]
MGIFNAINISATGLSAERLRMDVISKNIANANTTRTANGGPYRRQVVTFATSDNKTPFSKFLNDATKKNVKLKGVEVTGIIDDKTPLKQVYDPGHPDANEEGYVLMPNVDTITEMTNMITATRAYEANVTAMNTIKSMAMKALEIGR